MSMRKTTLARGQQVFSLGRLHMGVGFVPPIWGEQVQGDKVLMGGLMRGDLTLIDYIVNLKYC